MADLIILGGLIRGCYGSVSLDHCIQQQPSCQTLLKSL